MSETKHVPELAEALKKLLYELSKSASDIESHDYATRACVRNRLNFATSDLRNAITEIGRSNQPENFDWISNGFDAGIRRMALAARVLEALKKVKRLQYLNCKLCSSGFASPERTDLRNEAVAIEEEIKAIIGEAEGTPW